jgi:hypothetical protein
LTVAAKIWYLDAMPKAAQEYVILDTNDREKAKQLIGFDVVRLPAFCELNGKKISIPKESIFRRDGMVHYETLSPEYGLISHVDAFEAIDQALAQFGKPYDLIRVTLERTGAEMTAKFRINGPWSVRDSMVHPEFTLVNSYNCATSLSLRLGSHHSPPGVSTLIGTKGRWMHLGGKPEVEKFFNTIKDGMNEFGKTLVLYNRMHARMLTERALACVIHAVESEIVPKKMGKQIFTRVLNDRTNTLWRLYNHFLWPMNHDYDGTPSHGLLIQKNISDAFSDGGFDLFKGGQLIDSGTINEWTQRGKEIA